MGQILIADSGGTGTNWVFISDNGERSYLETESYHPANWNENFWLRVHDFLETFNPKDAIKLVFYGAGCLNQKHAEELVQRFSSERFVDISVFSDLHAAGKSITQPYTGYVAIAGTGSVVFHFDGRNVSNIIGGKGHELGDEGSGFYFGKLVLGRFDSNELSKEQLQSLRSVCDPDALLQLSLTERKFQWAQLAKMLSRSSCFNSIHTDNIRAFYQNHLQFSDVSEIALVGSYGFHFQELWQEVLGGYGITIREVVKRPIDRLID